MKKLLGIVVLGLLFAGNVYAEIVLRCKIDDNIFLDDKTRITVELKLREKKLYLQDLLFEIKTIGNRAIVAKKTSGDEDWSIKLDRFDGFIEINRKKNYADDKFTGYCKKYSKIF